MRHRLTQDRMPGARRQAAIEPPPRFTAVATAKDGGFSFDTRARPHGSAIHRNNPDGVVVFGMAGHRKTDITDLFRHVVPDALPALFAAVFFGRREIHRNTAVHRPPRIAEVVRKAPAAT